MAAAPSLLLCFFLVSLFPTHSATPASDDNPDCSPFSCGNLSNIQPPFFKINHWKCGYMETVCEADKLDISFGIPDKLYSVISISDAKKTLVLRDDDLFHQLRAGNCSSLTNFTIPTIQHGYISLPSGSLHLTLFHCEKRDEHNPQLLPPMGFHSYRSCRGQDHLFFTQKQDTPLPPPPPGCKLFRLPILVNKTRNDSLLSILESGFALKWDIPKVCIECMKKGHKCHPDAKARNWTCHRGPNSDQGKMLQMDGSKKTRKKVLLGIAFTGVVLVCLVTFGIGYYVRYRKTCPDVISSYTYTKSEDGYYGNTIPTQLFTYKELQEATNNFDPSNELGDGGFGIVYYGKLKDGRSAAIKRLYKNNCKLIEQFLNEINILSNLRHKNLVALYGCTPCPSRELLLVYEFIPNGTLADHLHGKLAENGALTWPTRMSIAIETADALAYLHAVDIIHRDIKTNNILLDNNHHVRVADFGLSRLFPLDKTHVSTAPQGTIGYMDPAYHRCYQLNEKSDVYSFGVVLIELISSKPAVDLTRHQDEIDLATMAINKICNDELHVLVDPSLGFESDCSVRRMVTSAAEMALRCLHEAREMRPSMQEVLEVLRGIESDVYEVQKTEEDDVSVDEIAILKNVESTSLDFVKNESTIKFNTPNASW